MVPESEPEPDEPEEVEAGGVGELVDVDVEGVDLAGVVEVDAPSEDDDDLRLSVL